MPNLVPGFVWAPIDVGNRAARRKGRGLVAHVAVSSSKKLVPGPLATRPADWHFYLPKVGPGFQFIDLDLQSWATKDGNGSLAAAEMEGGLGDARAVNAEPMTPDQLTNLAVILRHMHETEGVPLALMPDSRPDSRGLAPHRWGVDPWRVAGGESWSSARGKLCPGDAKVAQLGQVVELAGGARPTAPPPAPRPPAGGLPPKPAWTLPAGHYLGDIAGPAASHGGFYAAERPLVQWAQRAFIAAGCVPGISDWRSGWADGRWEAPTTEACRRWFARYRPGQPFTTRIYRDDWAVLGRG